MEKSHKNREPETQQNNVQILQYRLKTFSPIILLNRLSNAASPFPHFSVYISTSNSFCVEPIFLVYSTSLYSNYVIHKMLSVSLMHAILNSKTGKTVMVNNSNRFRIVHSWHPNKQQLFLPVSVLSTGHSLEGSAAFFSFIFLFIEDKYEKEKNKKYCFSLIPQSQMKSS